MEVVFRDMKILMIFDNGIAVVVYCSEFLATDPGAPGSSPGATRFSGKKWFWNGVRSAS
jgi:hypothetical protein